MKCKDEAHKDALDDLAKDILGAVEKSAFETLPLMENKNSQRKNTIIPGWKEEVKPHRDTAVFWHQIWVSCGKPINCEVHNVMKRTRNIYHYHLRKCKKSEKVIKKNKLLDACLNGNGDIFKEIKKIRKSSPLVATSIDGETTDIPGYFQKKYKELYNCIDDKEELQKVKKVLDERINCTSISDVKKVTPDLVKQATEKLNSGKSDPFYSFSSDCLKNSPDVLHDLLSSLLQGFLIHGHVSVYLLLATLVPIIKNKLDSINSSKNYRSIALSCLILKLMDWIVLILFGDNLHFDDLQFAYQPKSSTTMCTWGMIETVGYFLRNGSEVFTCMMDMSKAFDMVRYCATQAKTLT